MPRMLTQSRETGQWSLEQTDDEITCTGNGITMFSHGHVHTDLQQTPTHDLYKYVIYSRDTMKRVIVDVDLCNPLAACVYSGEVHRAVLHGVLGEWSKIDTVDIAALVKEFILGDIVTLQFSYVPPGLQPVMVKVYIAVDKSDRRVMRSCWSCDSTHGFADGCPEWNAYADCFTAGYMDVIAPRLADHGISYDSNTFSGCRYYVTIDDRSWVDSPVAQALTVLADDETKAVIMSAAANI